MKNAFVFFIRKQPLFSVGNHCFRLMRCARNSAMIRQSITQEASMTRYDQQILFTALAFVAVVTKEGGDRTDSSQSITQLARLLEDFCRENVPPLIRQIEFTEENGTRELDERINRHIRELRQQHETRLPDDRETLLQFYDRLQARKSRRMQSLFYAQATAELLADKVLNYLDEEIEEAEALS